MSLESKVIELQKGAVGENLILAVLQRNPLYSHIVNTSHDSRFFSHDIDFVALKPGGSLERFLELSELMKQNRNSLQEYIYFRKLRMEIGHGYEVKTDTKALRTGNIPFEFVMHDKEGWSLTSTTDFVLYVCTRNLSPQRVLIVDMDSWRQYDSLHRQGGSMERSWGFTTVVVEETTGKATGRNAMYNINQMFGFNSVRPLINDITTLCVTH